MINYKNPKIQGNWGLGNAIAYFTSLGKIVALPLTDSQDFDLIVETKAGKLRKIQVKTTTCKSKYGIFTASLKTCGGNSKTYWVKPFNRLSSDYLFVVTSNHDRYLIPTYKIKNVSSLNLNKKYNKYKLSFIAS